jgi:hypothetical protein
MAWSRYLTNAVSVLEGANADAKYRAFAKELRAVLAALKPAAPQPVRTNGRAAQLIARPAHAQLTARLARSTDTNTPRSHDGQRVISSSGRTGVSARYRRSDGHTEIVRCCEPLLRTGRQPRLHPQQQEPQWRLERRARRLPLPGALLGKLHHLLRGAAAAVVTEIYLCGVCSCQKY